MHKRVPPSLLFYSMTRIDAIVKSLCSDAFEISAFRHRVLSSSIVELEAHSLNARCARGCRRIHETCSQI